MIDIVELENNLEKEREHFNKFIQDNIIDALIEFDKIPEVQVHTASQRQILTDKVSKMQRTLRGYSEKMSHKRKELFKWYKTSYDIKLTDYEIPRHIESDMSKEIAIVKALEDQIEYYRGTISGLDKIGFSIKYSIEYAKFINGN